MLMRNEHNRDAGSLHTMLEGDKVTKWTAFPDLKVASRSYSWFMIANTLLESNIRKQLITTVEVAKLSYSTGDRRRLSPPTPTGSQHHIARAARLVRVHL